MNDKIKELMDASMEVELSHGAFGESEKYLKMNLEKFAELINELLKEYTDKISMLEQIEYNLTTLHDIALDEVASQKERIKELEKAIHFAIGFLEADGERECLDTLLSTGITGHKIFTECECATQKDEETT